VLTIIINIGYIFSIKVSEEGTRKNSNGIVAVTVASMAVLTLLIALYVGN